jgi:tetratricopeptide (TPR) repeat protein
MELSGFGWGLYIKGEFAKARAFAARIHALAGSRDDRRLAVSACNLMGAAAAHQGELAVARRWLEQGIAIFSELEDQPARVAFVVDLSVSMHARLAQVLAHLGLADQARAHIDTALARAGALGHPYGRMVGLFYAGVLDVRLDFPERVLEWAAALRRNVSENAFAQGEGMWRWLQGWALARLGKPEEGQALLRDGYQHSVRHTMVSGATSVLGHLADATLAAEGWLAAKTHLDQALELAQRNGERLFLPDLLLVQGTIALGQRHPAAARRSMHAALQEARGQEALWLEVSSLLALCELDDAPAEDIAALMQARGRVREGIDTALIARTDALLQARGLGVPPVA